MNLSFTKMHGCGNDFIFINAMEKNSDLTEDQIRKLCDRRFGIGADQLFLVLPPETNEADFKTDIFNADGGKVEMCGNGIRCFAKYVVDQKLTVKTSMTVETMAGLIKPEIIPNHPQSTSDTVWVRVDMGTPILEGRDIPVNQDGLVIHSDLHLADKQHPLAQESLKITCVSMGNPHCVLYVPSVTLAPVTTLGPLVENDPFFPNRVNVEFIEVVNRHELNMRVWERGAGETLACGTGACAAAVASVLNEKVDRKITIHLKGGDLEIEWDEDADHVFMTGPATTVFEGKI